MMTRSGGSKPKSKGGRPSTFRPEIGEALIDLVINRDVPVKHAARQLGVGVRTVYDWLQRAERDDAPPALAKWAGDFAQFFAWSREDRRRERYAREHEAARLRWRKFKASREAWWLERLGAETFWRRRLAWLWEHRRFDAYQRTVARLESEGFRIVRHP